MSEETTSVVGERCVCELCEKEYNYSRSANATKDVCGTCLTNRHRWLLKAHMIAYKGGCCQLCGYRECQRSLDFHHVYPEQKTMQFGGSHNLGWEQLRAELDKCVLLCRNCHGKVEEAVELVEWDCTLPILQDIEDIHLMFIPDPNFPFFTRTGWELYHPKFRTDILEWRDTVLDDDANIS